MMMRDVEKRPLKVNACTRMQIYDEFTKTAIRKKVHSSFFHNQIRMAEKVMHAIKKDGKLPSFSVRTVRNLMHDLGFVFKNRKCSSLLLDREDIQQWWLEYLRNIRKFRNEGRKIYYTDMRVNAGHKKERIWQDTTVKSKKQAFLNGLSTGLKAPAGKGGRLIIYAGCTD